MFPNQDVYLPEVGPSEEERLAELERRFNALLKHQYGSHPPVDLLEGFTQPAPQTPPRPLNPASQPAPIAPTQSSNLESLLARLLEKLDG